VRQAAIAATGDQDATGNQQWDDESQTHLRLMRSSAAGCHGRANEELERKRVGRVLSEVDQRRDGEQRADRDDERHPHRDVEEPVARR